MTVFTDSPRLPTIDLSLFDLGDPWRDHVGAQIDWAAAEFGIFRIVGHGIERGLLDSMVSFGRRYFARQGSAEPLADLCFTAESTVSDVPLLFAQLPGFRDAIRDYVTAITGLGHRLMTSFARGLRLGDNFFVDRYTGGAAIEFRVEQLAAQRMTANSTRASPTRASLLTLFNQDEFTQLRVRYGGRQLDVPYVPGALICSVDDLLSRLTACRYPTARYSVHGEAANVAISLPFSFGPPPDTKLATIAAFDPRTAHWHPPAAAAEPRLRERC